MNPPCLDWPSLDEGYTDEFGDISPEVYQAAGELWPQAENLINSKLHDHPAGMRLMFKAAAAVSRKREEQPDQIRDLKAYLWITFKHDIFAEVEKESRYQQLDHEQEPRNGGRTQSDVLNDHILVEELMAQMDAWTRSVFELRVLGYQFEDIAQMFKMRPNLLRSKFHKEIKKLSRKLFR
jgi:DNA-directed RNA polymerase specialized sigma24 family protein